MAEKGRVVSEVDLQAERRKVVELRHLCLLALNVVLPPILDMSNVPPDFPRFDL